MAKTKSKTLIILGCRMVLPPELERELTVIEFALPGKEELGAVLGGIMESANIKNMENDQREKVIDAASGLTTIEAENACRPAFGAVNANRTLKHAIKALSLN